MVLLVIDPQNDFCRPDGALAVPGAEADMARLGALIDRLGARLDAIHVTLDSHQRLDISHPTWFLTEAGAPPAPFTVVTVADLDAGRLRTRDPAEAVGTRAYLAALAANGRYPHVIWPEHCLVGSPGHAVHPALYAALLRWEEGRRVSYHWKGLNPRTEHFSAVRAEVPDPADPQSTNHALVDALRGAERVLVAGEASSHCVANTVRDLVAAGVPAERLTLLTDATSAVPGFEAYAQAFVTELGAAGMRLGTSAEL